MSSGKTPGNDGLSVEFYKHFWHILKNPLFESVKYSHIKGSLSVSQRQAIIKLLEKREKDKRYIENWRPISLLNVDTKLITKTLASRVKNVLPFIIEHDQTAYVKGRFIGESIRLISDILEVTDKYDIGGFLITADIEKAFDSLDHLFLLAALKKFGFGNSFINWIKIILNNSESCVINGGKSSQYFKLKRGARQGDPIAAYLFIIALEIFFICVRSRQDIQKIKVFGTEFLLTAYADDTTFFVSDLASAKKIFDTFEMFSNFSGLKMNKSTCEICGIGILKGVETALCNIKNVNLETDSIKVLGVHFTYNKNIHNSKNFLCVIKKMEKILNIWKMRYLTLIGKISVFKTLAISKIVSISHMASVPNDVLSVLKNMHKDFIWDGKRAKIRHATLVRDYKEGGLNDIDIDAKIEALQLSWLKRLYNKNYHPWKAIPLYLFPKLSPNFGFFPNLEIGKKDIFKSFPEFYQKII